MGEREEQAECRGCGKALIGKPFYMGGSAYLPGKSMKPAKVNHYGGFVCSPECDYRVSVDMHSSMPHCSTATRPDCYAMTTLRSNWPEHYS